MKQKPRKFHKDYAIHMKDSAKKTCTLYINGACIDQLMRTGMSESEAIENVESNAFWNAISDGEIGEDAWIESIEQ